MIKPQSLEASGEGVRLAVGGLLALVAAMGVGRFVYTPILPAMIDALGWSKSEAGLVASANFFGYLLGALVATRTGGMRALRTQLVAALAVSTLTTGAMAATGELFWFVALRLLSGIASAFVIVTSSTLVLRRLALWQRGHLSAVHFAGVGAGIFLSALLTAGLTAAGTGWRGLWLASAALAFVAAALATVLVPPGADEEVSITAPQSSTGLGAELWRLVVAYGLFGFGYVVTSTFIVTMVRMSGELKPIEPAIWALFGFAAVPSVALWAWLGARVGVRPAFALACLLEAAGVVASVASTSPTALIGSALLIGGTFMGLTALGLSAARQLAPDKAQASIGWMTASFALGQMIGPAIAGAMFDQTGSFLVPSILAALALVVAAVLVWRPVFGDRS